MQMYIITHTLDKGLEEYSLILQLSFVLETRTLFWTVTIQQLVTISVAVTMQTLELHAKVCRNGA